MTLAAGYLPFIQNAYSKAMEYLLFIEPHNVPGSFGTWKVCQATLLKFSYSRDIWYNASQ
jgi:hypothetical protein